MIYRKRINEIEATQWFKNGDHPQDEVRVVPDIFDPKMSFPSEGRVVKYYRNPDVLGKTVCNLCSHTMHDHGFIDNFKGGITVCPGDYVITEDIGYKAQKPKDFEEEYEYIGYGKSADVIGVASKLRFSHQ